MAGALSSAGPGDAPDPSRRRPPLPAIGPERLLSVGLACAGLAIATYLALYQARAIGSVWEPLFGDGSRRILDSSLARALPVPDAALGALAYACEIVTGLLGDRERWRTSPWTVVLFGLIATGMAAGGGLLVLAQAVVFHAFCTLCLASAALSITIVGLALGEFGSTLGAVSRERRRGLPLIDALRGRPQAT